MSSLDVDDLLNYIEGATVVPIIGSDLSLVRRSAPPITLEQEVAAGLVKELPAAPPLITLEQEVAEGLVEELHIDRKQLPPSFSLNDVAWEYIRKAGSPKLLSDIVNILKRRSPAPCEPLQDLAAIKDFKLYVTTTFDGLLSQSLSAAGRPAQVTAYAFQTPIPDLLANWKQGETPAVYHLFGRANQRTNYAVTDEDRLEFVQKLQSAPPPILFDQLRNSNLLFIGCSFPDWLTRFFLRTLRQGRLSDSSRYTFEAIADEQIKKDRSLVVFLQNCRAWVDETVDVIAFVAELARKWKERHPPPEPSPTPPTPTSVTPTQSSQPPELIDVFISYAREDQPAVTILRDALKKEGLEVWFDETKLLTGQDFVQRIGEAISRCAYFIPCISDNSIRPPRDGFVHWEWHRARVEKRAGRPLVAPFIQPVTLDGTPPDTELIPEFLRRLDIADCRDGTPPPELIQSMLAGLKALRAPPGGQ